MYGSRARDEYRQTYSSSHLQKAQNIDEQTGEAVMVLEGNIGVLSALRDFYKNLLLDGRFPLKDTCASDLSLFATQIDNIIHDSKMQIARGQLIARIIAARKTIVCTFYLFIFALGLFARWALTETQILQHLQSQATEKMEQLTISMQRDSLTVRIIAFLTFIYLPATFVSVSLTLRSLASYG